MNTFFFVIFFLPFLSTSSFLKANDSPIIVNLNASSTLDSISFDLKTDNCAFDKEYQKSLQEILRFDLNHNGKTRVQDKNSAKHKIGGIFQAKTLEITLPSSKKESVSLSGKLSEDRKTIHLISDKIFEALYQEKGIASSHLLYTTRFRTGSEEDATKWKSEIWEADYDGENAHPITKEGGLCVAPAFISSGKKGSFLYVSYKTGQSKIFLAPLCAPHEKKRVSQIRGNQLMPAYSPKAQLLAFVSDATGNPEVFIQTLHVIKGEGSKPWQATFAPNGAQGSPTFSPDGKQMAFVSNKDGSARIYIMNVPAPNAKIDELKPRLISKQNRDNTSPSWSPDGKKLAYSAITKGTRQIWIYDFSTKKEEQITFGSGHKENPAWAGNSVHIFYDMTINNSSELYLIHLLQKEPTKISKGAGEKRFPAWVPFST